MKKLEKGDWIKCHDIEELKKWIAQLSKEGYGAVVDFGLHICITSVPVKKGDQE